MKRGLVAELCKRMAKEWNDRNLVCDFPPPGELLYAITMVESDGDPWAIRFEPFYSYLTNREGLPLKATDSISDTERNQQKTSWGLMQVMGAVARERGFTGPYLSALCDPMTGLNYGAAQLALLLWREKGNELDAIAAYNAGGVRREKSGEYVNQGYVDKVLKHLGRDGSDGTTN